MLFFNLTASKTTLNSMLKEPSLIPDHLLANNIYQVSALEFYFMVSNCFNFLFFFFPRPQRRNNNYFLCPDGICYLCSPHSVFSLREYTLNFQSTLYQLADRRHPPLMFPDEVTREPTVTPANLPSSLCFRFTGFP